MQSFWYFAMVALLWLVRGAAGAQEPDLIRPDLILIDEEVLGAKVLDIRESGLLHLSAEGRELEMWLVDIRLPAKGTALRKGAHKFLRERLLGKTVEVHLRAHSTGGEARIGYALVKGADPRLDLVGVGLARYCPRHLLEPKFERKDRSARAAARGMWEEDRSHELPPCEGAA